MARGHEAALEDGYHERSTGVGCLPASEFQLAGHDPKIKWLALQGADMSSPGVMHARQFEPIEWVLLEPRDGQAYPASYEDARRRLISHLLSMPAAPLGGSKPTAVAVPCDPVAENPEFGWCRDPIRECASNRAPIKHDPAGGKQRKFEEFCYVSSFDRLTSKKRKASTQPARLAMGVHLLNVLTVTAGLVLAAFVYASVGGGFPGLLADVRSSVGGQIVKVRLILPGHDVGNSPAAPVPMPRPSVKEASADPTRAVGAESTDPLLYSTASIAFTPLK